MYFVCLDPPRLAYIYKNAIRVFYFPHIYNNIFPTTVSLSLTASASPSSCHATATLLTSPITPFTRLIILHHGKLSLSLSLSCLIS